jgi:hypothetical protein
MQNIIQNKEDNVYFNISKCYQEQQIYKECQMLSNENEKLRGNNQSAENADFKVSWIDRLKLNKGVWEGKCSAEIVAWGGVKGNQRLREGYEELGKRKSRAEERIQSADRD